MTHYYDASPARRQAPISKLTCSALLGMVLGLASLVAFGGVGSFVYIQQANFVLPGVSAYQLSLSGMAVQEAEATLRTSWEVAPPPVRLIAGNRSWSSNARALGLNLDASATAYRALDVGRGLDSLNLFSLVWQGYDIDPVVSLDPTLARQNLTEWSASVEMPPQDAAFHFAGGQVVTVPAQPGEALDVEATLALLASDPAQVVKNGYLPLITRPVAPAVTDVSAQVAQVTQLLTTPVKINVYDPITDGWLEWAPGPEQLVSWLSVQPGQAGPTVAVMPDKVAAYLAAQGATLGPGRFVEAAEAAAQITQGLSSGQSPTVLVRHLPTTYTVQPGDNLTQIGFKVGMPYWRILQANPGLEANGLHTGQELSVPSKDELLPLPVVLNKRIVVSLGQQRMWTYENRQLLHEYIVSTGIDRSPTQPGVFQVQTHESNAYASIWNLWMPHFLGIYEAWPGFMNGFHGLPMLASGRRLWADVLGQRASYGCIILNLDEAEALYNWAEAGVVVEIRQ